VHPTKAEVRFQNPNDVFTAVQRAIRRALLDSTQTPAVGTGSGFLASSPPGFTRRAAEQMDLDLHLDGPGWHPHQYSSPGSQDDTAIPFGPEAPSRPRTLPMLRVIGQMGASYIVAEGPAGMYLIDQHAAHERVLYEQFMNDYAKQDKLAQYTLSSQTIELPAPEARLIDDNLNVLKGVGFDLEAFGPNTFVIRSVPALLTDTDPIEAVYGIIEELEHGDTPGQTSIEEKIIQRVCKQAAVKAGTILSLEEMQGLIRQLERAESPHTCPHGRPTMLHMTSDQLARQFGRK
jgi:DNA mismatch repair protein MutL